jgi:hypothetical protein
MTGPATNITSLTVLIRVLGRRATAIYLSAIALCALGFGLLVDRLYQAMGISAQAVVGRAGEAIPHGLELGAAVVVLALSVLPLWRTIRRPRVHAEPAGDAPQTHRRTAAPAQPPAGGT